MKGHYPLSRSTHRAKRLTAITVARRATASERRWSMRWIQGYRVDSGLGAPAKSQLTEHRADMMLHGLRRDPQSPADFGVGQTGRRAGQRPRAPDGSTCPEGWGQPTARGPAGQADATGRQRAQAQATRRAQKSPGRPWLPGSNSRPWTWQGSLPMPAPTMVTIETRGRVPAPSTAVRLVDARPLSLSAHGAKWCRGP